MFPGWSHLLNSTKMTCFLSLRCTVHCTHNRAGSQMLNLGQGLLFCSCPLLWWFEAVGDASPSRKLSCRGRDTYPQVLIERLPVVRKFILPIVRGSSDDGAVLCTQNSTFSIKEAETSNSLLLVPSLVMPNALEKSGDRSLIPSTVEGVFYKYMEVLPTQPTIKRLQIMLREKSYKGGGDQGHGLTQSELLDTVQASEEEITQSKWAWSLLPFSSFL